MIYFIGNFSKTIIYLLGNATINEDETKTLAELGFLSGSEFTVRLHLKGGLWNYAQNVNLL